jgi:8-oxo-dGTP pyrophosphatase MutT (NUDIX family)
MNSNLYGKSYRIPQHIIEKVRNKLSTINGGGNGVKRAKFIINNGMASYSMLKRLKNFFDYCNPAVQGAEYELAGGKDMRDFVERTLGSDRNLVQSRKQSAATFMPQVDTRTIAAQGGGVDLSVNEEFEGMMKNGLTVIFTRGDGSPKVLLLKRCDNTSWEPKKWALVGGKIDDGETPEEGAIRETFEETGLQLNEFIGDFVIRTGGDHIEYVYVTTIEGEPAITLSDEHDEYGWFTTEEIQNLDRAAHLDDFIALAKQKLIVWGVENDVQ